MKKKRLSKFLWWTREISACVLWGLMLTKLFICDFDVHLLQLHAPEALWLLSYRFFLILGILILLSWPFGRKWFSSGVLYILFYPFIFVLLRIPSLLLPHWPIFVAFAPAIHSLIKTFRATFIWYIIAIVATSAITASNNQYILVSAMIFLGAFLIRHFRLDLRRAFQQSTVFSDLAGVVRKLKGFLEQGWFVKQAHAIKEMEIGSKEYEKQYELNLESLFLAYCLLEAVARKLKHIVDSRKLDLYLVCNLIYTFLITIIAFALQYQALFKIDPMSFESSVPLEFWRFLGFSFSTFLTANSQVIPVSNMAQLLYQLELVAVFLFIVILVFIVFTVARDRYKAEMEQMLLELNQSIKIVDDQMGKHYQLTSEEIEDWLFKRKSKFVNQMRHIRGLGELQLPEATEDKPENKPEA